MNNLSLRLEAIRKEKRLRASRNSLLDFTLSTKQSYNVNWHHSAYASVLDSFIRGEINRLMIFMPPQHGKSELSTRRMPAKLLGDNPDLRIAIAAYGHTFAKKFNLDVQRIIDSIEYNDIYPNTQLAGSKLFKSDDKGLRNTDEFEVLGFDGSLKSVGIGGSLTGNPVDVLIIDDPYKDALQAYSDVYRNRVRDWYDTVAETRLHNDSRVCLTMTRWHDDDLAGTLLKLQEDGITTDDWAVVNFAAIKESEPTEIDPREAGEALWPDRHSLEKLENVKAKNPSVFASLYQGRPAPNEGNIVKGEYFGIINSWELPNEVRAAAKHFLLDTAFTEKQKNDPSGIMAVSKFREDLYIWDVRTVRKEFPEFITFVKQYGEEQGATHHSKFYIEPKASGKSIAQQLKRFTKLNVIEHQMIAGDKTTRLNFVMPKVEAGRVFLVRGAWNDSFIDQCKAFPNAKHDEEIDLLVMAVAELLLGRKKGGGYNVAIF